jgi:hypothetical protein
MRLLWILFLAGACGGGSPGSALTPAEARLGPDELITPRMCALVIDRVFDLVEAQIPQDVSRSSGHGSDSIRLRARIEQDRARLKQSDELARCAQRYNRWNYDCAMRADTAKVKDCLPGMLWVKDP